jgi:Zn-dependent M28 family amino/carboxypeptidase
MDPSTDFTALSDRLRGHVQTLARVPRSPGTGEHRRAQTYIRTHLEQAGFTVREASFVHTGAAGVNVLTQLLPDRPDGPLVIVGAHFDSVLGSPGADDNASAVAALLELARWVRPRLDVPRDGCRLQLVAYDLEEFGYIGSIVHSNEVQQSGVEVRGMISLEMLGYTDLRPGSQRLPAHLAAFYPNVGNFIGVCGNEASQNLVQTVAEAMKRIPGLPVESIAVPGKGELLPEVRLSDHQSFWEWGFPALMITDTSFFRNPHYHTMGDTPETLDYAFLARVTAGVCAAVERLTQGKG